jgi:hypothetical protein
VTPFIASGRRLTRAGALSALILFAPLLEAQTLHFPGGVSVPLARLRVRGGRLIEQRAVSPQGGEVERSFLIADAVLVDWPRPEELDAAQQAITRGKAEAAAALLESLRAGHAPFARVPGSWWGEILRMRLRALLMPGAGSEAEAARVARELATDAHDPDVRQEALLALIELEVRAGRPDLAEAMLTGLETQGLPARMQVAIQLLRADLLLARRDAETAAEAYLKLWVFFRTEPELMPRALRGAIAAFALLGDETQATRLAAELARLTASVDSVPAAETIVPAADTPVSPP